MTDERRASLKVLLENPYLINPPKNEFQDDKKGHEWNENFDAAVAFLGQTLWSKTLPFDGDFKVDYMDLNDLSFDDKEAKAAKGSAKKTRKTSTGNSEDDGSSCSSSNDSYHPFGTEPALAMFPGKDFDPSNKKFKDNELEPQPMFKKCKKQLVPNDKKDDRYWVRRLKNNVAAKRSRDARRIKENQIVMRAAFLEKENYVLKMEMDALRRENQSLQAKLRNMTPG